MKKKIIVLVVLLLILTLALFACGEPNTDGTPGEGDDLVSNDFKFNDDMTVDEILDAINGLKSLTIEMANVQSLGTENEFVDTYRDNCIYYYGEKIYNICGMNLDGLRDNSIREYAFYEDGVCYYFCQYYSYYIKRQMSEEKFKRMNGFNVDNLVIFKNCLLTGDYEIIDGNLYVGKLKNIDGWAYIIRDMNKTNVELPSEFSDYKTREFTDEPFGEDIPDDDVDIPTFTSDMIGYDGSEVTITFYHTMSPYLVDVLDKYIAEFIQLYPNIHIEHEQVGGYDDVQDEILSAIPYGTQPNMAYCYSSHIAQYNNIDSNAVMSLDDFISCTATVTRADGTEEIIGLTDAQINDFIEGFYNEGKQFGDDKMYMMPLCRATDVLYYNKTFFDEHNLTLPTTWAEMEEVCAKIKDIDPNSVPLGYDSESNWFINLCAQYGSPYTSVTGDHFLFDNETNRSFVEMIKRWYEKGYVTTAQIEGSYTSSLFTEKTLNRRCYMSIASSAGAKHQRPYVDDDGNYQFEVGIASIPQVDGDNAKVITQGPSLCILNNGDVLEATATWLFIKYLTTNVEFQAEFSRTFGYMSVLKSVQENETYAEYLASADGCDNILALSLKVCYEQMDAYFAPDAFVGSDVARSQVGELLVSAITGDKTIDEAFTSAVENCNNAISDIT